MGTISEKLTYLNDTRLKIKDSLNKFGSNITENDTFRSYSNVLNDIYDKLPKVSGNGSDFTLENAQNGKLDSFGMDGNTEQDSYTGQQLFNVHDNPTYDQYITLEEDYIICERTNTGTEIASSQIYTNNLNVQPSTTYLCVCEIIEVSGTGSIKPVSRWVNQNQGQFNYDTAYAFSSLTAGQKLIYPVTTFVDLSNKTRGTRTVFEFRAGEGGRIKIRLSILMDTTITSDTFVYEPYVGGTPSPNPDYPQEVKVVNGNNVINIHGKNLFDKSTITSGKRIDPVGVPYTDENYSLSDYITIKSNTTYTRNLTPSIYQSIAFYTNDKTFISRNTNHSTITTPSDAYYVRFSMENANVDTAQLEEGNQATTYEPYQSQDFEIDLLDYKLCEIENYQDVIFKNNQLSEYYDSTLDEDSWYIKKNIGKVVLDGSESDWALNQYSYFQYTVPNTTSSSDKRNGYSSHFKYEYNTGNNKIFFMVDNYIRIKYTDLSNVNDFKTWLSTHNVEVYYILSTPTYEKITNETLISQLESIETFTGLNNFSVSNENNVLPTLYVSRLKELGKLE